MPACLPACVMDVVYGYDPVVMEDSLVYWTGLWLAITESVCVTRENQFLNLYARRELADLIALRPTQSMQSPFHNVLFVP